jgi:hypothetical protein
MGYVNTVGKFCKLFFPKSCLLLPSTINLKVDATNKMDLQEVGCGHKAWIKLAQDTQLVSTCECGNEPLGYIKFREFDYLKTG